MRKTGLIVFSIGAVYMIGMGVFAGWGGINTALRNLTIEQFDSTIWSRNGILFIAWGASVPAGSLLACIGILIFSRTKAVIVWIFGTGIAAIIYVVARMLPSSHYPSIYGLGGTLILIFFLAILILWAKKQEPLENSAKTAGYFQLASYVFFLTTAWYLCKTLGTPYMKALEKDPLESPVEVIVFVVLGWFFLFLSHYKSMMVEKRYAIGKTEINL